MAGAGIGLVVHRPRMPARYRDEVTRRAERTDTGGVSGSGMVRICWMALPLISMSIGASMLASGSIAST